MQARGATPRTWLCRHSGDRCTPGSGCPRRRGLADHPSKARWLHRAAHPSSQLQIPAADPYLGTRRQSLRWAPGSLPLCAPRPARFAGLGSPGSTRWRRSSRLRSLPRPPPRRLAIIGCAAQRPAEMSNQSPVLPPRGGEGRVSTGPGGGGSGGALRMGPDASRPRRPQTSRLGEPDVPQATSWAVSLA